MEYRDIFEEWNTYAGKKELLSRDINLDSIIENSGKKIIAITGVRRAGKTSVLMLLLQRLQFDGKKAIYINLEDSRLKNYPSILDEVLKWFGDEGFILLDEITNSNDWEGWLARNHELLKGKLHIIISSSRSAIIAPNKSLRGRILAYEIFPLSFSEFLRFKKINREITTAGYGKLERALEEYVKFGGFPEVVLTENQLDKIKIINSYFNDIIGLDIAEMSRHDLNTVEVFSRYVLQSGYFSASKCLNFLKTLGYKIGKEKLLELESFSAASYLFYFVPIFSNSIKNRLQYPRKSYSGDLGFYYATTGKTDLGRSYETLVFLELKRRLQENQQIYYWKNKDNFETDFLIRRGMNNVEAIQVAYDIEGINTKNRELRSLVELNHELGKINSAVITKNIEKTVVVDEVKIKFIPILKWVLEYTKLTKEIRDAGQQNH